MTTVTLARPATVVAPRAAAWAANLWMAVSNAFQRSVKVRAESQAAGSVLRESSQVRELAWNMMSQDPRMAADLMAAADRHERHIAHLR